MKRPQVTAVFLSLVVFSSAAQAALERIEPVASSEKLHPGLRRQFTGRFGAVVKAALETEAVDDDGAAAERIFKDAERWRADPQLFAYALDHVVQLGSVCPDRQKMVYDALRLQAEGSLRPERECYEKMMLVAPRVAEQLGDEEFVAWLTGRCAPDARRLAKLCDADGQYDSAIAALKSVQPLAAARQLPAAKTIAGDIEGLEFLQGSAEVRKRYEKEIGQPGDQQQARIFLGIVALARDGDLKSALEHLKASGDATAGQLAIRLKSYAGGGADTEGAFALAQATIELADEVKGAYLQCLLFTDAEGRLTACLADRAFGGADRKRAEGLRNSIAEKSKKAVADLPALVQEHLKSIRQQASQDTEYVQTFFGVPLKESKRVVYIVDRSGSMTDSIAGCKYELVRAIWSLNDDQQFQVLFYSTGSAVEMPGGRLFAATDDNKRAAKTFIQSVLPIGQTDPSDALKRAFELKPDTIYLLTDGEFQNDIPLLIEKLNRAGKVTINTICFVYSNGEPMLKEIARGNNGAYKYVGDKDLDKADLKEYATPTGQPSSPPGGKPSSSPVVQRRAVPPGKPMPKAEEQKLSRLVSYLQRNRERGGNRVPRSRLEPSMKLVEGLLDTYGKHVPPALRSLAEHMLGDIRKNNPR